MGQDLVFGILPLPFSPAHSRQAAAIRQAKFNEEEDKFDRTVEACQGNVEAIEQEQNCPCSHLHYAE